MANEYAEKLFKRLGVSRDTVSEQAYLVSRGVRPVSLLGSISNTPNEMANAFTTLKQDFVWEGAIPFVIPRKDMDCAMCGFASTEWVIDLLKWSYDHAPLRYQHQIVAMLLGYSPEAIAQHDFREFAGMPNAVDNMI